MFILHRLQGLVLLVAAGASLLVMVDSASGAPDGVMSSGREAGARVDSAEAGRVEVPLVLVSGQSNRLVPGWLSDEFQGETRSMSIHLDGGFPEATSLSILSRSSYTSIATYPVSGTPADIALSPTEVEAVVATVAATGRYPEIRISNYGDSGYNFDYDLLSGTPGFPVFVDSANAGVPNPTGSSWATAFPSLQAGIDAAAAAGGGDVRVFNGFYHEPGVPGEPARSIQTGDNVRLFGSFNVRNGMAWSRDMNQLRSIIVGRISRAEIAAPHVMVHDDKQDVYFDGFTLLGGACVTSGVETGGGGIMMSSLGETGGLGLNHLRIIGNTAGSWAQAPTSADPAWDEIVWTGEEGTGAGTLSREEGGGGIYGRWCLSRIRNSTILGNIAMSRGGGLRDFGSSLSTQNVELIGNASLIWQWDSPSSTPRLIPGPGSACYNELDTNRFYENMSVWDNTGTPTFVVWPWPKEWWQFPWSFNATYFYNSFVTGPTPGPHVVGNFVAANSMFDRPTQGRDDYEQAPQGVPLRRIVARGSVTAVETVPGMLALQDPARTWVENDLAGAVIVLDVPPIVATNSPLTKTYGMISHNTTDTLHALAVTEAPFPSGPVSYVLYAPGLEASSPGVDVADMYEVETDLRGRPRSLDGDGIPGETGLEVDLGAHERADETPGIVVFADPALEAAALAGIQALDPTAALPIQLDQALLLTTLEVRWRNVTSLQGMEYCQNLTHLDVFGNQIVNLAPLSNLKKLTHLDLGRNPITDLEVLESAPLLTYLEAGTGDPRRAAEFANPDPDTYVGGTPAIEYVWVIWGMEQLQYLGLAGNRLRTLPDPSWIVPVTTLILANNPIESFYGLSLYENLEVVDFSGTGFYDPVAWSFAYEAPLQYVDLSNTSVDSLDEVPGRATIETLKLNDNALPDFSPTWGFENVRVLEVARNNFTNIEVLAALPGLAGSDAFVDLRGNPLNREARCVDLPALRARMASPDQVLFDGVCVQDGEGEESSYYDADQNDDAVLALAELLRVIQFYNLGGHHCAAQPGDSEDGFLPGANAEAQACSPHTSDYSPQDWRISLSELLRVIQFYNARGYVPCEGGEDGFCPVL